MKVAIADWLWDTGILQFGYFVTGDNVTPVRFCPEYLPAYPQLLAALAEVALTQIDISEVDHLIVMSDSVPLGVACSLRTDLSLVYSRGRDEAAVYDLVGAYNSGHRCALLMNYIKDQGNVEKFISNALSVGLETRSIVTLLEVRPINQLAGISVRSVFRLINFVQELLTLERLSEGQAQAVLKWINEP